MNYIKLLFFLFSINLVAQTTNGFTNRQNDTLQKFAERDVKIDSTKKVYKHKLQDFKFYTQRLDSMQTIDLKLSIENYYNQNDYRKDTYGDIVLPNLGQGANQLLYNNSISSIIPQMGYTAKLYDFKEIADIRYFDVKAPTTEIVYQSGYNEGQMVETTFTHSPSKQFNYAVTYKGNQSEGRYQEQQSRTRDIVISSRYQNKKNSYRLWTHYASQNINNEESAGIQELSDFLSGNSNFSNRENFTPNLSGASSILNSRRFYLNHEYDLLQRYSKDSIALKPLYLRQEFSYEKRKFTYQENTTNTFFGSDILSTDRKDYVEYTQLHSAFFLATHFNERMELEIGLGYDRFKYGYENPLNQGFINIPASIDGNLFSIISNLAVDWRKKIFLKAHAEYALGSEYANTYLLTGDLLVKLAKKNQLRTGIELSATQPNLNLVMHQSFYNDFNYSNTFEKINTQHLWAEFQSKKLVNIKANLYNIDNYVFIDNNERPRQNGSLMQLYNITLQRNIQYKNFYWDNTLSFQKVANGEEVLPLPTTLLRSTLYYQKPVFKNKATLQTGISLYWYDKFESREYFPVLGEYSLQTLNPIDPETGDPSTPIEIGNYPLFDLFMNLRVKRMRIYLKAQNINSVFSTNDLQSAPKIPYNDWVVRVGIKWFIFT